MLILQSESGKKLEFSSGYLEGLFDKTKFPLRFVTDDRTKMNGHIPAAVCHLLADRLETDALSFFPVRDDKGEWIPGKVEGAHTQVERNTSTPPSVDEIVQFLNRVECCVIVSS